MKSKRFICLSLLCTFGFAPIVAKGQSFWLHSAPLGQNSGTVAATDTDHFVIARGQADFLESTTDYGNSWNYVITDSPKYNLRKFSFSGYIHPSSSRILVGCNDHNVGQIVESTDGGLTWKDSTIGSYLAGQPAYSVNGVAALDSNHLFILLNGDSSLVSSNGGTTWKWIPCPGFSIFGPIAEFARPIAFLDTNTILIESINSLNQTSNSVIYRTTDLGATWDSTYRANSTITKLCFLNSHLGYACGIYWDPAAKTESATITKTDDGGTTWAAVLDSQIVPISSYAGAAAGLYSLAFADSLHGIACGDQGLILQTTDGGATWNQMHSDYTTDEQGLDVLSDLAYPDTNHAMIVSSDGRVLVYHPDGILSLPNVTYPKFSPPTAPRTFDVTWDPVPGATRYSIKITTSGYPDSTTALVVRDTNVTSTYYSLANLNDTAPPPETGGRQYYIALQAFNATNASNVATRTFIVYKPADTTSGVTITPSLPGVASVYPDPATNWLIASGFHGPLTVLDALGHTHHCSLQNGKLDISTFPAGIYYLGDGRSRAKFVKE